MHFKLDAGGKPVRFRTTAHNMTTTGVDGEDGEEHLTNGQWPSMSTSLVDEEDVDKVCAEHDAVEQQDEDHMGAASAEEENH